MKPRFYELQKSDVGKALVRAFGRAWSVRAFMGRILPMDVGKRVYQVNADVLQVGSSAHVVMQVESYERTTT